MVCVSKMVIGVMMIDYEDDDKDEDDDDLYIIGAVCLSVGHKSDYFAVSPKSAYK